MNISVSVNNDPVEVPGGATLGEVLARLDYDSAGSPFAVAVNCTFVPRHEYATRQLAAGDRIDVVAPVAGG